MESDLAQQYEALADRLARWQPSQQFKQIFDQLVLGTLENHKRQEIIIVDAGCGHGTWLKRALDYCDRHQIRIRAFRIDLSQRRIEIVRRELGNRLDVFPICGDMVSVLLPSVAALVYSAEVFLHLDRRQQRALLKRWKETLRPGGAVVIIDKDRYSWHSIKVELQKRSGRIGRRLWGRYQLFDEEFAPLFAKVQYPSFRYLAKVGRELGLHPEPLVKVREFTGLKLVKR